MWELALKLFASRALKWVTTILVGTAVHRGWLGSSDAAAIINWVMAGAVLFWHATHDSRHAALQRAVATKLGVKASEALKAIQSPTPDGLWNGTDTAAGADAANKPQAGTPVPPKSNIVGMGQARTLVLILTGIALWTAHATPATAQSQAGTPVPPIGSPALSLTNAPATAPSITGTQIFAFVIQDILHETPAGMLTNTVEEAGVAVSLAKWTSPHACISEAYPVAKITYKAIQETIQLVHSDAVDASGVTEDEIGIGLNTAKRVTPAKANVQIGTVAPVAHHSFYINLVMGTLKAVHGDFDKTHTQIQVGESVGF
jgi:hypothetical protein